MAKFGFLGVLLISIALFGSCSNNLMESSSRRPVTESPAPKAKQT